MPWNKDDLRIGGFGQLPENVDATGRMIRNTAPPVPRRKGERQPPAPAHKPETISPTRKGNEILDFIGKLESSDNYNIIYGNEEKPLTTMTLKKVQKLQKEMIDEGRGSSAVGRYQFRRNTLKEAADKLGVD